MSDTSILRRHRDFFWALTISIITFSGIQLGLFGLTKIPVSVPIGIFTLVFTLIGTSFIILQKHNSVITRAKDNDLMIVVRNVFKYPFVMSVFGIVYTLAIYYVFVDMSMLDQSMVSLLQSMQDIILIFMILYVILNLAEAFSFLRRIIEGEASSKD